MFFFQNFWFFDKNICKFYKFRFKKVRWSRFLQFLTNFWKMSKFPKFYFFENPRGFYTFVLSRFLKFCKFREISTKIFVINFIDFMRLPPVGLILQIFANFAKNVKISEFWEISKSSPNLHLCFVPIFAKFANFGKFCQTFC